MCSFDENPERQHVNEVGIEVFSKKNVDIRKAAIMGSYERREVTDERCDMTVINMMLPRMRGRIQEKTQHEDRRAMTDLEEGVTVAD